MSFREDDQSPFDPHEHAAQLDGLPRAIGPAPRRVLDLGCGHGRVLVPLAELGYELVGLDRDDDALAVCRTNLGDTKAALHRCELADPWPIAPGSFDAVLCLGNTFMTFSDVNEAVMLLARAAAAVAPGGVVVLDDVAGDCWIELADGNWMGGTDESGTMQMVWHHSDAVFALRSGSEVDSDDETLRDDDRLLRLWTDGALHLASRLAGLSAPARIDGAHLIVMGAQGNASRGAD